MATIWLALKVLEGKLPIYIAFVVFVCFYQHLDSYFILYTDLCVDILMFYLNGVLYSYFSQVMNNFHEMNQY